MKSFLISAASILAALAAQPGNFSNTGNLSTPRTVHTATRLLNTKVLVAGGWTPGVGTFASAEIYDPATGLFSATGSLSTARRAHAATLLADGKVLIAGGRLPPNYFTSAELYDPATGLFSSTGSLNAARAFFTATLLLNGKVLVVGGLNGSTDISSAELYDPGTGLFSPTGSLSTARQDHTATLLANGKVLVTGGDSGSTTFASAELYDPDTGLFSAAGSMTTARQIHTATLLANGKVLVAAGYNGSAFLASAELYDPNTGLFSPTGSLSAARQLHTATLLPRGQVLVTGGQADAILASAELYDPNTGLFSPTGSLSNARRQQTATLLANGAVLIAAGDNVASTIGSAELYMPQPLTLGQLPRYIVRDLGTLQGGTSSYATGITTRALISGHVSPPDGTWHAAFWYQGWLGAFGPTAFGGRNSVAWGINEKAQVSGEAETSIPDPNGEDFCGFKALGLPSLGTTCVPFLWQNGVMSPLSTLGGPNGSTNKINSRGDVVGMAENTTRDPACPGPQALQFKPVIWRNGKVQELPTMPGDPEGIAFGINDNGQAVGGSGTCIAFDQVLQVYLSPSHALLWQDGTVTDLGNLGGAFGNVALTVNSQGQVVGNSDLSGDAISHGFLWTKETGMQDLSPFPSDIYSGALDMNDKGEVVGTSLDANFDLRAVVWLNGVPVDLNTRISGNSGLYLQLAESINSTGQIVGFAQTMSGDTHAYLATPINSAVAGEISSSTAQDVIRPVVLSETARKLLQQRLRFGRLATQLKGPR